MHTGAGAGRRTGRRRHLLGREHHRVTDTAAISLRGLAKGFGSKVAVADIDLDVPRGCFFGLVGPNGAGKTTTLRMTTGLLRPDAGAVWVDGSAVGADTNIRKAR